jgi:hypothetical protein
MKTYKREVALVLFLWLGYIVETKDVNTIEILVWPIFTFSALAFGMDWFGKSVGVRDQSSEPANGRGTKSSSEHTDR